MKDDASHRGFIPCFINCAISVITEKLIKPSSGNMNSVEDLPIKVSHGIY